MINRERPKCALSERMGSSAAFARQLCTVAKGNLLARARVWQLEKKAQYQGADLLLLISLSLTLLLGIVLASVERLDTDITLTLDTVLSKEFQGESR